MKQEDKELLLKDLCARLPYGVKMNHIADTGNNPITLVGIAKTMITLESPAGYETSDIEDYMPYLFPLKTMTIEQRNEFYEMTQPLIIASFEEEKFIREEGEYRPITPVMMYPNMAEIDWLFKRHFDVFGLIEKGLAIDATGLNIY